MKGTPLSGIQVPDILSLTPDCAFQPAVMAKIGG